LLSLSSFCFCSNNQIKSLDLSIVQQMTISLPPGRQVVNAQHSTAPHRT
jgi:hypothetical protein